jgi:uncharacterized protein (TIGR03437 family)
MVVNAAAQQAAVPLGTTSTYGALAGDTITNTGATTINGDLGLYPGTSVTGSPTVTGATHVTDGAAQQAKSDLHTAFLNAQGRTGPTPVLAGALGGKTLTPGLYKDDGAPASLGLTGTLTLDFQGNPNAVFIFQSASTLTTEVGSIVHLINTGGGTGCNVFWQVGSAATLKGSTSFVGTILAYADITAGASATVAGRLLAGGQANGAGALTLNNNTITTPVCSVAPTGSIQVVKNTVGGNGTFAFTSNFGLTSPLITSGLTASQTVSGLAPGSSYSVSETVPSGWTQTSASCTSGIPTAVTVVAGATTICTFTNTVVAATGSIQVVKNTVGGNGAFTFTSNFGLTSLTTSGNTASQTFGNLAPGSGYSLSETLPTGWTQTSASCTNGTPAAIIVAAGVTTTCIITNTYAAPTGSIKVVKNTVNGDGTFAFTSNFGLTFLTTIDGTASLTFSNLLPGASYSVSEIVPSGWTQTFASCTNGTLAAITVVAGATTTCTITNTQQGSFRLVKNTVGGDGTFTFNSNFGIGPISLTTSGGTASQTFGNLRPGGYAVSETVPTDWTQTSASCTNGSPAAITVVAGVTTTCIFTNTKGGPPPLGLITVVKNTVGGNGTFAFTSNFGLTSLTTSGGTASQTFSNLTPGSSYSVSETVSLGWTQTFASCTNGTPAAITVVAGATTTCTITNTQQGSVKVVKNTVGGDGTFAFTSNFGLTSLTTSGGTASLTISNLLPGSSYSVSEIVPSGWAQTSASCTNGTPAAITVVAGVTTTCIITNTKGVPPALGLITVVKNTVGGDGTFAFTSNFGLTSLTTSGGTASLTFSNLSPGGSYSMSETVPSGWTQTSASCTNGTPAAITVMAGMTTTCTITNTQVAVAVPDVTIRKSHAGNFRQGDTGDTYTLTVTNTGQGPTVGAVTVSDTLPAGLTATAIGGTGWTCVLATFTCTRSDALAPGASYPDITVTVNVAGNPLAFNQVAGSPSFQTGDILISMTDGTVQWRHSDWTLVKVLTSGTDGQAKGMAFDSSGNLYVTHWIGSGSSGNDVATFDRNGILTGLFGSGFNCNPSSIVFDNSGNAYVGQADCSTQILKFDSSGNSLAQYSVAVENRGSYHIVLDPNQCTMYYTSEGPDVKRFNVCSNTQMSDFNSAPLPDPVGGAQEFSLLPGGGMLVADFNVIARLDASGNLVRIYDAPANDCWLGMALDRDGTSFWASNWCASSVTRFDLATGNVIESHVVSDVGFMVKQLAIPGNIFSTAVTNTAAVAGGGELNTSNDSASDATTINPPAQLPAANNSAGIVNAASYVPTVAAGSIASVFGSNLSSVQAFASTIPLPTTLASTSFQIGGRAAPLFFVSPSQVNLQIPWELAGQSQASVLATVGGVVSSQQTVSLAPFAPGLFTLNGAGSSQGTIVIAGTPLFAAPQSVPGSRPAHPGEFILIYCTGLGAVSNQPATGMAAQASPLSVTIATPTVTIGGIVALVPFSGLAPGAVGLYQVNVQVPMGAPTGDAVPVILSIGGVTSNTVTIAVQ